MAITRQLFGGAITAQTPPDLLDASCVSFAKQCGVLSWFVNSSDVRQVPDTQEVFMYPRSNVSIILEILQRVEASHYNDAIRYCFRVQLSLIY